MTKTSTSAKHSKAVGKTTSTWQTKGFGFVQTLEKGIKCASCQKWLRKGTSAITYHRTNSGAGRTNKYHTTIECLAMLSRQKQDEFAEKKWTDSVPRTLAEEVFALNAEGNE